MNKRIIIYSSLIAMMVAVFVIAFLSLNSQKEVSSDDIIKTITIEQSMDSEKPSVVMFYSDWCSNCVKCTPRFNLLKEMYHDKYNFVIVDTDNPKYLELTKNNVVMLPSVFIFDPTIDNKVMISHALYNDEKLIQTELDRYLRVRSMIKLPQIIK